MSQAAKRFEAMKANPRDKWTIADIELVCSHFEIGCEPPTGGGSHYKVSHQSNASILTIPYSRRIKAIYIVRLVSFIEDVLRRSADGKP